MRDIVLRKQKDRVLTPLASRYFSAIHPNWVSATALLFGLAAAIAVWQQAYWLGLGLWILNRILDGLDGVIARTHDKQSDFGGYLDLFLDFIVYLAIPLAFVAAQPTAMTFWAALALLSAFVLNLLSWTTLSAILEKRQALDTGRQTTIEMPTGIIEGTETVILYSLFFIVPDYVAVLFGAMAVLTLLTAVQRVRWAARNL